jgi:hypothetical protein
MSQSASKLPANELKWLRHSRFRRRFSAFETADPAPATVGVPALELLFPISVKRGDCRGGLLLFSTLI